MPTKLEADDHFVKHVSSSRLKRHENGKVYGVFPHAFELRAHETELSGSWLEFFVAPHDQQVCRTAEAIRALIQVKRRDGFVIAQVKGINETCLKVGARVRVLHEPSSDNPNPAYATIRNLPRENLELLGLLATEAFTEIHVAGDVLPDLM